MANTAANIGGLSGARDGGFIERLKQGLAKHREYRRTVAELKSLDDRDLRDLGISRFSIHEIAHEAVYGA